MRSHWIALSVVGLLALHCTTKKEEPQASPQDQSLNLSIEKPKAEYSPNPTQTIGTAKSWLANLSGTDTKRLSLMTGFPFYSYGLIPNEGPDADTCRTKEKVATKEAFAETAACFFKNTKLRDNIPANLYIRSVFELKIVTLDKAFADKPELKEILSRKKELEAKCCRTYVQGYFPGEKLNAYILIALEWMNGDVKVVGAVSEIVPVK